MQYLTFLMRFLVSLGLLVGFFMPPLAVADPASAAVAQVISSVGEVRAQASDGVQRKLRRRSSVYNGDVLITGENGKVQIRFSDGAMLALRPLSEFRVEDYQYTEGKAGEQRAVYELLKGGMRTITGAIGKKTSDHYQVKTNVASIGVRGTYYGLRLCQGDCVSATGEQKQDGLYGAVAKGAITVSNDGGDGLISQDQYFQVSNVKTAPKMLLVPPGVVFDQDQLPKDVSSEESTSTEQVAERSADESSDESTDAADTTSNEQDQPDVNDDAEEGVDSVDGESMFGADTQTQETEEGAQEQSSPLAEQRQTKPGDEAGKRDRPAGNPGTAPTLRSTGELAGEVEQAPMPEAPGEAAVGDATLASAQPGADTMGKLSSPTLDDGSAAPLYTSGFDTKAMDPNLETNPLTMPETFDAAGEGDAFMSSDNFDGGGYFDPNIIDPSATTDNFNSGPGDSYLAGLDGELTNDPNPLNDPFTGPGVDPIVYADTSDVPGNLDPGTTTVVETVLNPTTPPLVLDPGNPAPANAVAVIAYITKDDNGNLRFVGGPVPNTNITNFGTGKVGLGVNNRVVHSSMNPDNAGGTNEFFAENAMLVHVAGLSLPGFGINWGRWDGDYVTKTDGVREPNLGSMHFIYSDRFITPTEMNALLDRNGAGGGQPILPGLAVFNLAGGTPPTDQWGNEGVVQGAKIAVDFVNQFIALAELKVSINGNLFEMHNQGASVRIVSPIVDRNFFLQLIGVCAGCATNTAQGEIQGSFLGQDADAAIANFRLEDSSGVDTATGALAYTRNSLPPDAKVVTLGDTHALGLAFSHPAPAGINTEARGGLVNGVNIDDPNHVGIDATTATVDGVGNVPIYAVMQDGATADPNACNPCIFGSANATLSNDGGDPLGVNWGRWNGDFVLIENGVVTQNGGPVDYIYTDQATGLDMLQPNTKTLSGIINFSYVGGPAPIELRADGTLNQADAMNGTLGVNFGVVPTDVPVFVAGPTTNIDIDLTTAAGYSYYVELQNAPTLEEVHTGSKVLQFSGCTTNSAGCSLPLDAVRGEMSGVFVGPNAQGFAATIELEEDVTTPSFGATGTGFFKR